MKNYSIAYLMARLVIATSMFGHGLVRLPKLSAFSAWMTDSFKDSMMPLVLVRPFSLVLPVIEFSIGLLLLAGLFTRQALVAGGLVMLMLIFGSCLMEKWEWVTFQMFYGLFFALLYAYLQYNQYALDKLFQK